MESSLQGEQIQELELDYNETEIVLLCAEFISEQRKINTIEQIPKMIYMNFLKPNISQTEIPSQKTYVAITPPISSKEHADIIFTPTGDNFQSLRAYLNGISENKPHQPFIPLLNKMILENRLIDSETQKEFLNALNGNDVIREALLVLKNDPDAQIRISIPILIHGKWTAYEIKMHHMNGKVLLKVVMYPTYEVIQEIEDPLHTYLIGLLEKNSTCDVKVEDSQTEIIRACFSECYGIMTVQDCFDLLLYGRECSIIPEKFAVILLEQHKHFLTNIPIPLVDRIDRIILKCKSTLDVRCCLNLQGIIQGIYEVSTKKVLAANDKAKEAIFNIQQMLDELALLPNFDKFAQMLGCIRVLIPYVHSIKENEQSWIHLCFFFQSISNYVSNRTKKNKRELTKLNNKIQNKFEEFCFFGTQLFHFRSNSKKWKLIRECKNRYSYSLLEKVLHDNKEKMKEMKQQETEATETGKEEISDAHSKNEETKTNSEVINVLPSVISSGNINEVEWMNLKFQEHDNKIPTLTSENCTFESEKSTMRNEITTLKSENCTIRIEITTLKSENCTMRNDITTLNDKITTLTNENNTLNDKITTLTNENNTLNDKITTLTKDNISIRIEIRTLTNNVRDLIYENRGIMDRNGALANENSTLKSKFSSLNITLTNKNEEMTTKIRKFEDNKKENTSYFDRLVIREILNELRKALMKLMGIEGDLPREDFFKFLADSPDVINLEQSLNIPNNFNYHAFMTRIYDLKTECSKFIHSPKLGNSPADTFFRSLKRVYPDLIKQEEITFSFQLVKALIPDKVLTGK